MEWVNGSIPEVVEKAVKGGKVFVVVIEGNSPSDADTTDQLFSMLDAAAAHINPRSVSIKIRAGSKTCEQFSQLFGEVPSAPAVYFVQASGGAVYARWDGTRSNSELAEAVSNVFLSNKTLPVVASTSQVKPDIPSEEDPQVNKAEAAMEERSEAAKKSRLSGGAALTTKREKESQSAQQTASPATSAVRIQFRFPDGRTQVSSFSPTDPLQRLYDFAGESWTMRGSFSLSAAFPRRQLDAESRETTLEVIGGLVPSATVLVLPSAGATSSSTSGFDMMSLVMMFVAPFTALWGFLSAMLGFGGQAAVTSTAATSSRPAASNSIPGSTLSNLRNEQMRIARTRHYQMEGNVARLRQNDGDDDENSTWNGNSTQQQ